MAGWRPTPADAFSNNAGSISAGTSLGDFNGATVAINMFCVEEQIVIDVQTPDLAPDKRYGYQNRLVTDIRTRVDSNDSSSFSANLLNPHSFEVILSPSLLAETSRRILIGFTVDGRSAVLNLNLTESLATSLVAGCVGPWHKRDAQDRQQEETANAAQRQQEAQATQQRQDAEDARHRYEVEHARSLAACTPGASLRFRKRVVGANLIPFDVKDPSIEVVTALGLDPQRDGFCRYRSPSMKAKFTGDVDYLEPAPPAAEAQTAPTAPTAPPPGIADPAVSSAPTNTENLRHALGIAAVAMEAQLCSVPISAPSQQRLAEGMSRYTGTGSGVTQTQYETGLKAVIGSLQAHKDEVCRELNAKGIDATVDEALQ